MLEIDLLEYETDDFTLCQNCNQNINAGDSCGNCKQKMFMELKKLKRYPLKIEQEPSIIFECSGNEYYFSEDGQYSATITSDNNLIKVFSFIKQKEFKVIKMSRKLNIDQMVFSQDNTILLLKTKFLQKVLINVYGIQFDYHKDFGFENQKLLTFWTKNNAIYFLLTNKQDYQLLLYSINLQMNGLVLKQNLPFLYTVSKVQQCPFTLRLYAWQESFMCIQYQLFLYDQLTSFPNSLKMQSKSTLFNKITKYHFYQRKQKWIVFYGTLQFTKANINQRQIESQIDQEIHWFS